MDSASVFNLGNITGAVYPRKSVHPSYAHICIEESPFSLFPYIFCLSRKQYFLEIKGGESEMGSFPLSG